MCEHRHPRGPSSTTLNDIRGVQVKVVSSGRYRLHSVPVVGEIGPDGGCLWREVNPSQMARVLLLSGHKH